MRNTDRKGRGFFQEIQDTESALNIAPNILKSQTLREFSLWLDKMWKLNPKETLKFLKQNSHLLSPEQVSEIETTLGIYGVDVTPVRKR